MDDAGTLASDGGVAAWERDEELAVAAQSDPAAFGILYARHRLAVFRYLRARSSSEDDAAELTATVFARALVAIPRYRRTGGGFLAWLLRIGRNAAIDARRRPTPSRLLTDVLDERKAIAPEENALHNERQAVLLAAVNRLPTIQRDAVVLRYAARLTAREIGYVLGKSDQATQKILSRALAAIRETYRVDD